MFKLYNYNNNDNWDVYMLTSGTHSTQQVGEDVWCYIWEKPTSLECPVKSEFMLIYKKERRVLLNSA